MNKEPFRDPFNLNPQKPKGKAKKNDGRRKS
jgi:hypothetical protein